jgi:hypothetical protein
MQQNSVKTNGLSDNNLTLAIRAFLLDRKAQNVTKGTLYLNEAWT